jgi:hypothetical protein
LNNEERKAKNRSASKKTVSFWNNNRDATIKRKIREKEAVEWKD